MLSEKSVNQMVVAMVLLLHGCGDATTAAVLRRRSGARFLGLGGCSTSTIRNTAVAFCSPKYFPAHGAVRRKVSYNGVLCSGVVGQRGNIAPPLGRAAVVSSNVMKHSLAPATGATQRKRRRWRAAPAALGAGAPGETVAAIGVGKERSDGGSLIAPPSKVAQAYYERKREAMRDWTQERQSRDLCARCRRARQTCLCSSLPSEAVPTSTRFIILQHPTENKKRVTGTVPLVLHCLSNCRRVVVRYDYSEDDLRDILRLGADGNGGGGTSSSPLLLFPYPDAEYLEDVAASRGHQGEASSSPTPPQPQQPPPGVTAGQAAGDDNRSDTACSLSSEQHPRPAPPPPINTTPPSTPSGALVLVIDGTWSQAKQILSRYPFLSPKRGKHARPVNAADDDGGNAANLHGGRTENEEVKDCETGPDGDGCCFRPVKFRSAGVSSYGFRREPAKECLSTLESVAYTLEVLEGTPQGLSAAGYLREAFAAMVAMQVQAADAAGSNPRFVNRKERTANRRLTPKKDRS